MSVVADFLASAKSIDTSQPTTGLDRRIIIELEAEVGLGDLGIDNSPYAGVDEIQYLKATQAAGGTFDMTVGVGNQQIAVNGIAYNADGPTIQTAVDAAVGAALAGYTNGDIDVKIGGSTIDLEPAVFTYDGESVSNQKHALGTVDGTNLTTPGSLGFSIGIHGQQARNVWAILAALSIVDFGGQPPVVGGSIPTLTKIRNPAELRLSEPTLRRLALEAECEAQIPGLEEALLKAFFEQPIGDPTVQEVQYNAQAAFASTKFGIPNVFERQGFGTPKATITSIFHASGFNVVGGDSAAQLGLSDGECEGVAAWYSEDGFPASDSQSSTSASQDDSILTIDAVGPNPISRATLTPVANGARYDWTEFGHSVDLTMGHLMFGGAGLTAKVVHQKDTLIHNTPTLISGLGFKPDAIIAVCTENDSDAVSTADSVVSIGFADASLRQGCIYQKDENGANPSNCEATIRDNRLMFLNPGEQMSIELLSMEDNGFRIRAFGASSGNWTADVTFLCLKFPQPTDAEVSFVDMPQVTGPLTVTDLGFKPRCVLRLDTWNTAYNSLTNDHLFLGLSIMTPELQVSGSGGIRHGFTPARARAGMGTKAIFYASPFTSATRWEGDLTQFTDDGYTIDWTKVGGGAVRKGVQLALR